MEIIMIGKILGIAVYAGIEYWLGKTDKVKAGSVVEAVANGVMSIFGGKK